jgi:hypothetical protein
VKISVTEVCLKKQHTIGFHSKKERGKKGKKEKEREKKEGERERGREKAQQGRNAPKCLKQSSARSIGSSQGLLASSLRAFHSWKYLNSARCRK